ncbi:MAG: hypothetical protein AVDCRST_MAG64-4286 [uncultured Phycisphaerae bacterium]|uniref:Uncharacterized protein n=1 Tax=uncultured Phycisphaerae bacterium TaxID=904963 RepID=A0A6J4QJE4_9BACT|nr:MAG: hypothetical protein AVDCRST_MAG64-4286 [uncultured Phycisphaerae bacterium]
MCSRFFPLARIRMTSDLGLKFFRTEITSTSNRSIFDPLNTDSPWPVMPGFTSATRMCRAGSNAGSCAAAAGAAAAAGTASVACAGVSLGLAGGGAAGGSAWAQAVKTGHKPTRTACRSLISTSSWQGGPPPTYRRTAPAAQEGYVNVSS